MVSRFSIVFASSIAALLFLPLTSHSQDYSTAGPGYGSPAPTQAQIDADNRRFRRIREGLPPEDDSEQAIEAPSTPNGDSLGSVTSNGQRTIATGSDRRRTPILPGASVPTALVSPSPILGNEIANRSSNNFSSSRSKPFALSPDGLIEVPQSQSASVGLLSSANDKITWSQGFQQLAAISGMSIDLKSVPSGKFDVSSLTGRSLSDARDLLNGMLFAQGLTLIESGQKLSIVKLSEIKPAMVPLVTLDGLDQCLPNQFVRVEIALSYVLAGPITKELAPLMSKYGRIGPMESILKHDEAMLNPIANDNQIQIVDSAQFARRICQMILKAEQTAASAAEERFFSPSFANAGLLHIQLQRLMELREPLESQSSPSWIAASPNTFRIQFGIDRQANRLSAIALPQQIEAMDAFRRFADDAADRSLQFSHDSTTTRIYPLRSTSPERLIEVLSVTLEFNSRQKLSVHENERAIIVSGSLRLHQIVADLLEKFEPGKRRRETIQLHSISANQALGIVQRVFAVRDRTPGKGNDKIAQSSHVNARQPQEFHVSANAAQNRLLLWCTAGERREIDQLFVKFGVWRDDSEGWIRVIDADIDTQRLINTLASMRSPVSASIDASGKIVLCSKDFVKLDEAAEELSDLMRNPSQNRDFSIKHVSASWLRMNLEERYGSASEIGSAASESHLEFYAIANTLSVRGATTKQIQSIEWLVAANDVKSGLTPLNAVDPSQP